MKPLRKQEFAEQEDENGNDEYAEPMDEHLEPGELAIVPSITGAGGNNDFQQELREEI